jgi:hypothetical protein
MFALALDAGDLDDIWTSTLCQLTFTFSGVAALVASVVKKSLLTYLAGSEAQSPYNKINSRNVCPGSAGVCGQLYRRALKLHMVEW